MATDGDGSARAEGAAGGVVSDAPRRRRSPDPLDRSRSWRYGGLLVVALALVSVATTFLVLTGLTPVDPTPAVIVAALVVNGGLVGILIAGVLYEVWTLWSARSAGSAGARLHVRIVALFSLMAVLPASLVAAVATITLSRGLDRWFQERTTAIVESSVNVADAYVDEHARVLRGDLIAMAGDIDRARALYDLQPSRFDAFMQAQTSLRGLPAAYLMREDGSTALLSIVNPNIDLSMPPPNALADAEPGRPILIAPGDANQVGAVMKLSAYRDLYLYIARPMDPRVVDYLRLTAANAQEYIGLRDSRLVVQVAFGLVYAGVTLVLLVAAIWLGFGFANRLVAPIRHLIGAADDVARGRLDTAVPIDPRDGDIAHLGETFNLMTKELASQQARLVDANEQIDRRRRFTEAVLSGVSAGVIGIGPEGTVSLANRSARDILGVAEGDLVGRPLVAVLPEIAEIVEGRAAGDPARSRQHHIVLKRGDRERTVAVRVTADPAGDREAGYVVTLDDITDLVAAQRTSAWADVARRIAHEIKNPLTPIQLSAERIKRRYGKRITDDREVFDQCIDTIVRQVGDIGRMVNEFSAFARMPAPVIERRDMREAVREAVFLHGVGHPDVETATHLPDEPVVVPFDQRLVTQAIANLVKNAAEAIEQTTIEDRDGAKGRIEVTLAREDGHVAVEIVDNGIGLPTKDRQRLLEPYMTTREKGTGLGLAIVRKIAEEHGGRIELLDAAAAGRGTRGAFVRLVLPADGDHDTSDSGETGGGAATPAANGRATDRQLTTALPGT